MSQLETNTPHEILLTEVPPGQELDDYQQLLKAHIEMSNNGTDPRLAGTPVEFHGQQDDGRGVFTHLEHSPAGSPSMDFITVLQVPGDFIDRAKRMLGDEGYSMEDARRAILGSRSLKAMDTQITWVGAPPKNPTSLNGHRP